MPALSSVNLDASPGSVKDSDWKVLEHIPGGSFAWNPKKVALYRTRSQREGILITGFQLLDELTAELEDGLKTVCNANLLDFLMAEPHLIPPGWQGNVHFFGTRYKSLLDGNVAVRCLSWQKTRWRARFHLLKEQRFGLRDFILIFKEGGDVVL